jgi:hypothetical protein
MSVTATWIGTCRVQDPLAVLERQGRVICNQTGVYGMTHTSKEALQLLRSMAGEVDFPSELRPYVMDPRHQHREGPEFFLNDLSDTDVLVVELSSVKLLTFREFYFQIIYTRRRLRENAGDAVQEWWQVLQTSGVDVEDRSVLLRNDDLSSVDSAFVMKAGLSFQAAEEIRSDMKAIADRFGGPVLFVTHFDAPRPDTGRKVPGRDALIEAVRKGGSELGYRVYDPTADVISYAEEHGELRAAVKDIAHYTERFIEERIAGKLLGEVSAAASMTRVG